MGLEFSDLQYSGKNLKFTGLFVTLLVFPYYQSRRILLFALKTARKAPGVCVQGMVLKVNRKFFLKHKKSFRWHLGDYKNIIFSI